MSAGDYWDRVNPELLKLIPPDAKTVLEIGCGAGALCAAHKRVNPSVDWHGIDINCQAIEIARTRLDHAHCFNSEQLPPGPSDQNIYDCLVLGDILEHMRDPRTWLKKAADILKPGAVVLASIPNVGHWTIIRDLLNGEWEYQDEGLLDRTHLRFFTLKSIRTMFEQAGLQIFECRGRRICNEGYDHWLNGELKDGVAHDEDFLVYQWVIRAIKPPEFQLKRRGEENNKPTVVWSFPKLHIHAVTAEDCCARPRIHEPFAMLSTIPGVRTSAAHAMRGPIVSQKEGEALIWIQQRHRQFKMDDQDTLLGSGKLIIAEVDDLPEAIGMDPMALKAVHAIQCSTEALAEVCRQYNPNVMIFENQIAELPRLEDMDSDGNIHIFYGAQNRQNDWKPIMPALNRVLVEYGKRVSVIVIHDREFYDALDPSTDRHFFPFCEYDRYRGFLRECDIALLPLEDTPFNKCKSDIKFLECAAEGVAVLAGMTVYSDFLEDNPDNIFSCGLYAGEDDFTELLDLLIKDARVRHNLVENAYAYVRDNRLLSQHYRKRYEWYLDLIKHKQRLTDELLARVPELSERLATV